MSHPSFIERTLDNGLRVYLEPQPTMASAACGFLVRTGSRDESAEEEGVSHFLEHMCFKGSANITCQEINQRFDRLGSRYNAFTSQEKTVYYGWVPAENLIPQIDLLAEMMRSTLPEAEFLTEKNVVLEEIAMYRDSLESSMFDIANKALFAGTPLERSVLGTVETIGALRLEQMVDYHRRRYVPNNMVFVASGQIDCDVILKRLECLTATWPSGPGGREQPVPTVQRGQAHERNDKFRQQALMLCFPAPAGSADDARVAALSSILGGDNSRIFWEIIQRGICPDAGSFHMAYADVGIFVIYALSEPQRTERALASLREQAAIISRNGVTSEEVSRVRNAARTAVARDGESPMRRLGQMIYDIDILEYPRTLDERLHRIAAVQDHDIHEVLAEYPITGEGMLVRIGPADAPTIHG